MQSIHRYNEKTASIERVDFTLLGNKEILNMSCLGKNTPGLLVCEFYDNGEPKKGGLVDLRMGVTSHEFECSTCKLNNNSCPGHFGHLKLASPVFSMGFFEYVITILRCVCIKCSKLLVYKNEEEIIEILKSKKGKNRLNEIKNLVKNISYCQKVNYGCGAPVPKIKSEKKKSVVEINIIAEYTLANSAENEQDKKTIKEILTPEIVYNILKNISDRDSLILGIDPTKSRPEDMIHLNLPIPPASVRPSVRGDFMASTTREDHLTIKIADILKANQRLAKHMEGTTENQIKYFQDHVAYLQYHVATYYDNESLKLPQSEQKGIMTKSLASRLKGKEGRIRYNLMGKRTDFSARTVITPDPYLSINELGLPIAIAKNITFPEIVTPENHEKLSKLVRNGREIYPGANFLIPVSNEESYGRGPIDLRFRKEKIDLKFGDIVERHTVDGDMFLLNRQPTLHKLSMLGHKCKVIDNPNYCTFRINPNVTTPYGADFDGDEMNVFCPQSIETQIELEELANLKLQIITPQSSLPIIAMKQDQLLGTWNLSKEYYKLNWKSVMNLLSCLNLDKFDNIKKKDFTGKEVFSFLIPDKINLILGNHDKPDFLVKNGVLEIGVLGQRELGVKKKNSLIQLVWDEYGVATTQKFLDNITKLSNSFNMYHGVTVGLKDLYVDESLSNAMKMLCNTVKLEIFQEITEFENNPEMFEEQLFEKSVNSKLTIIRENISKLIINNSSDTNMIITMMDSGAKGSAINYAQMAGCIGQQDFRGTRMPKNYNQRALPYHFKNDDRPESRGFIERSYLTGLNLVNFFFQLISAREGLIDVVVRSVTPDTKILIIQNNIPKVVEIGPWIDAFLDPINITNPDIIERDKNNFELLKINDVKIPTLDEYGNVSWGDITAITRHDPGFQLYEIITKSGRKVIVPESKSLLIYNKYTKKLEQVLTNIVNIGDKVPITMNLSQPIINDSINLTDYVQINNDKTNKTILNNPKFTLDYDNGLFIGIILANCDLDLKNGFIQIISTDINTINFIEEFYKKFNIINHLLVKINNDNVMYDILACSEVFANFLHSICYDKHFEKQIPEFSYNAPDEFLSGLINGFISQSGYINIDSIIIYNSSHFAEGINILLSRLGIFSYTKTIDDYEKEIIISSQWIKQFKLKIGNLINNKKNLKLQNIIIPFETEFELLNDIILDEIMEINLISPKKYNKLYDLTIPTTYNFIIFNGMGVVDTAESGYIQRKLIKATEDMMVNYDGTVRNSVGRILQFQYGDSGSDTVKQYEYNFKFMEMGNEEIKTKYGMSKEELSRVKGWSDVDNKNFINLIIKMRNKLRHTQIKSSLNYLILTTNFMISVNLYRIVNNIKNELNKDTVCNEPKFIMDTIEEILEPYNTRLYCLTSEEMQNKNSVKYQDDRIAKTTFSYALIDMLSPKKCIFYYKFSKKQILEIKDEIIKSFNKSIVEPGEMVGIIAAQSLGEPVTQLMLNSFHSSGVSGKGGTNIGVDRIKEVFSLSKNQKVTEMQIYLNKEYRDKKDFANKVASYIKFTTIKDLRDKIEIFYDPTPFESGGFMDKDNIGVPFYTYQANKNSCSNNVDGLPWLVRIEFNKEKLLNKEVLLIDIKSQFCFYWEKRHADIKNMRRDKRDIINKITNLAILSNTDNDDIPIIHVRFDMNNYTQSTLVDFMDILIDNFKLKGITGIVGITGDGKAFEERIITFDNPDNIVEKNIEYVIYTRGINMDAIKNIIGIDLNRTICNEIITIYENFGIEAARNSIIIQIITVLTSNGSGTNYQHIEIFGDLMTHVGTLTSIDRHGLNKLDTDPFSRASFEQTIDQLITAAVFNEVDHMKSVSSRIMAGLCIKGGTGLCDVILDTDLLENSEYTTDIGLLYNKTYTEITTNLQTNDIEDDIFIPDI